MTESSAAVSALSADETPTSVPGTTADGPSSETPVDTKGDDSKKKRTSVRALRLEIANLTGQNRSLRDTNDRIRGRLIESDNQAYRARDENYTLKGEKATQAATLASARGALEFVIAILAADKSPAEIVAFLPQKATEFGINLGTINDEVIAGLDRAYAKATKRAVNAELVKQRGDQRRPGTGVRAVSGSGIDSLIATLAGLGDPDPTRGMGDPGDLLAALFGDGPSGGGKGCGNPNCRNCNRR